MKKLLLILALLSLAAIAADAQEEIQLSCPDDNHPHAIDMGTSFKIACCNVGATKPEDYGDYYAWGEIETKNVFTKDTYSFGWWDDALEAYGYKEYYYNEIGVYDNSFSFGDGPGRRISSTQYDVAHVKWGGCWRMTKGGENIPTGTLGSKNTEKWVTYKGTIGLVVTSYKTGNSIFIPAAGRCDSILRKVGEECLYWNGFARPFSSQLGGERLGYAKVHLLYPHNYHFDGLITHDKECPREYGLPVRPVYDETLGVSQTLRDGVTSKYSIYNLYGIKVADKASNINALPPGIYIVNGKKFVVK